MYPLYQDILLNDEQQQIVLNYIKEIGFAIPGTSPTDYSVVPLAKYVGWNFQSEDLEAYAVGLLCSKPGFEKHHTFIRMSRGQLLGLEQAPKLPVNEPGLANELLRMQRWRELPTGPARTGVDAYLEADGSIPGIDLDLTLLEDILKDIDSFVKSGKTAADEGQFDLSVDLGILLSGRYKRLKHFQKLNQLKPEQENRLLAFEEKANIMEQTLESLNLPSLRSLEIPENRKHSEYHS